MKIFKVGEKIGNREVIGTAVVLLYETTEGFYSDIESDNIRPQTLVGFLEQYKQAILDSIKSEYHDEDLEARLQRNS